MNSVPDSVLPFRFPLVTSLPVSKSVTHRFPNMLTHTARCRSPSQPVELRRFAHAAVNVPNVESPDVLQYLRRDQVLGHEIGGVLLPKHFVDRQYLPCTLLLEPQDVDVQMPDF